MHGVGHWHTGRHRARDGALSSADRSHSGPVTVAGLGRDSVPVTPSRTQPENSPRPSFTVTDSASG